jgi:glucosamine-6-phosphate deaminase
MTQKNTLQGIHWVDLPDSESVGKQAASIVAEQLSQKPDSALVFPTGKTPIPMYTHLRNMDGINWEKSRLFQLDEYIQPSMKEEKEEEPPYQSFASFMRQALWDFVGGQKFYLEQYFDCPAAYEALVTQNDGPDLIILGIGQNGHVAFNEPGSFSDSPTRVIKLADQTQVSNFGAVGKPGFPTQAITLGLRAILKARHILMLATGERKKNILQQAFNPKTPPSPDCPASWLKQHPNVTILTDFEHAKV